MTVTTRVASQDVGVLLRYDQQGKLLSSSPACREIGTTVRIERLFEPVPVRRQELVRSLNKHFAKLMQVLYAYALVHTDTRMQISNTATKQKYLADRPTDSSAILAVEMLMLILMLILKLTPSLHRGPKLLLNTTAQGDLRNNVTQVLGAKQVAIMQPLALHETELFSVYGYVSRGERGCGRNLADRQFLYINKRPVDLPRGTFDTMRPLVRVGLPHRMNE